MKPKSVTRNFRPSKTGRKSRATQSYSTKKKRKKVASTSPHGFPFSEKEAILGALPKSSQTVGTFLYHLPMKTRRLWRGLRFLASKVGVSLSKRLFAILILV